MVTKKEFSDFIMKVADQLMNDAVTMNDMLRFLFRTQQKLLLESLEEDHPQPKNINEEMEKEEENEEGVSELSAAPIPFFYIMIVSREYASEKVPHYIDTSGIVSGEFKYTTTTRLPIAYKFSLESMIWACDAIIDVNSMAKPIPILANMKDFDGSEKLKIYNKYFRDNDEYVIKVNTDGCVKYLSSKPDHPSFSQDFDLSMINIIIDNDMEKADRFSLEEALYIIQKTQNMKSVRFWAKRV